jgi:hypothetical protein
VTAASGGYNLTTLGSSDWAHWGRGAVYGNLDRKSSGGGQISNVTSVGSGSNDGGWSEHSRTVTWSDGTPTASGTDDGYIWSNGSLQTGFSFTVPADASTRTLLVFYGASTATCTLRAHLSDGSAADVTDTRTGPGAWLETVVYHAGSPGQSLTVTLLKTGNNAGFTDGSADLVAAMLQAGSGGASGGSGVHPNLIQDPGFENQTATGGGPLVPPWNAEGPGVIGLDGANGRNGSKCGYIYDGSALSWSAITQTVAVSPNTNYTLTAWIQTSNPFPTGSLGARTTGGTVLAQQSFGTLVNYSQVTTSFNSGSNTTVVVFAGFSDSSEPGAWIHLDDVSLVDPPASSAGSSSGSGSGGACGATGAETVLLLGLTWALRRRRPPCRE